MIWQRGQCDMSWTQIVDDQNGIFGKQFISTYANDIDTGRSLELLTIAKNVYRECSEFVHGNYEKLNTLTKHELLIIYIMHITQTFTLSVRCSVLCFHGAKMK